MWNNDKKHATFTPRAANLTQQPTDQDEQLADEMKWLRKRGKRLSQAAQNNLPNVEDIDSARPHRRMPYHRMKSVNWHNHLSDEDWWEDR